ncbi:IS701 family transposase [Nocardia sp. NPDC004750]
MGCGVACFGVSVDEDLAAWVAGLDELFGRVAGRFLRAEPRLRARLYARGLLAPLAGKNGWTLAEAAGERTPDGMQRLLHAAAWDADGVRDDVRGYAIEHLGDPDGVLVVDETGFLKKGTKSAGVQRQYSGTAGRIENCQLGVFCAYTGSRGHTLIDRELYLPKSWTEDRQRCREASVPDDVVFATKATLAKNVLARALDAGVPARWVTADEAYGGDGKFRAWLDERRIGYVVAVPRSQTNPRRNPTSSGTPDHPPPSPRRHTAMVDRAPTPSIPGEECPLPATTPITSRSAAGVLVLQHHFVM